MSGKKIIRRIVGWGLVLVAIAALALLLHPDNWRYYTDGMAIRQSARDAEVRIVLWEEPLPLEYDFNAATNNIEPVVSQDGRHMVFARGKAKENAELFAATWDGEQWSEPEPLTHVNTPADELGPEFSSDQRLLYFYSDRSDGLGGYDLWVSPWNGDYWDEPVNLGPEVNSPFNEYDPALAPGDDRLFFSSNRPLPAADDPTSAGRAWQGTLRELVSSRDYDIFRSSHVIAPPPPGVETNELVEGQADWDPEQLKGRLPAFTKPVRMAVLNTSFDEGQVDFTPRGDFVYFSSNRDGGLGGFDIYRSRIFDGAYLEPEALGRPVNTRYDDMDPALWMEGHSLVFSSNRHAGHAEEFTLYESTTREVLAKLENARLSALLNWLKSNWWMLLLALLALLALWWLARLFMNEKFRREMSLLTQCILFSVFLHLLLAFLLSLWYMTTVYVESSKGPMQVAVNDSALAKERLSLELREEVTPLKPLRTELADAQRIEPMELQETSPANELMNVPTAKPVDHDFVLEFNEPDPAAAPEAPAETAAPTTTLPELTLSALPKQLETPETEAVDQPDPTPVANRELAEQRQAAQPAPTTSPDWQPAELEVAELQSEAEALAGFAPAQDVAAIPELPVFELEPLLPLVELETLDLPMETPDVAPVEPVVAETDPGVRNQTVEQQTASPLAEQEPELLDTVSPAPSLDLYTNDVQLVELTEPAARATDLEPIDPVKELAIAPVVIPLDLPMTLSMESTEPAPEATPESEKLLPPRAVDLASTPQEPPTENAAEKPRTSSLDLPETEAEKIESAVTFVLNDRATASIELAGEVPEQATGLPEMELGFDVPLESKPLPKITYALRDPDRRNRLIEELGGNDETEAAISRALQYLAKKQEADGRWDIAAAGGEAGHDAAATGLAALCFMGHGATHQNDHLYRDQVARAMQWLSGKVDKNGRFESKDMYDQGIATIALAEAYALTKDEALKAPLERAIQYIIRAQHPQTGGWRYQPGERGDTSVFGWQVMALRSAKMSGLDLPDAALEKSKKWLEEVASGKQRGHYGYENRSASRSMVAEGMFAQQLLGRKPGEARMMESARYISSHMPDARKKDYYYWYYGCLALYQHKGPVWEEWNTRMKTILIKSQERNGPHAGSWDTKGDKYGNRMGRIVTTALSTLSLEVYYRYLPMYGEGYSGEPVE